MKYIIGKFLHILLFFCSSYIVASIDLKIVDAQSQVLSKVGIGQPFFVEVTLDGDALSKGVPDIEGMEALKGQRVGYRMETINGVSSVTYTYRIRVDHEGVYAVGPARVGSYESSVIHFEVSRDACYDEECKDQLEPDAILRYEVDKKEAVVGEKIKCYLKFLYRGDITLKNIGRPEPIKFDQENASSPELGVEMHNGKEYQACYWHWNIYPCEEGEHIIPAYSAEYTVAKKKQGFWAHFGQFTQHDLKSMHSNGVKIFVHALPPSPFPVCALGTDIRIRAFVDTVEVVQSEAVLFTLEFEGDMECQKPMLDSLADLPSELKCYRSHVKGAQKDSGGMRIEFIIQALKAGSFEIPAQRLCYFDTRTRTYQEIETQPINITVQPSVVTPMQPEKSDMHEDEKKEDARSRYYHCDLVSCNRRLQESVIPWWFFFIMLGLSFLAFIYDRLIYSVKWLVGMTGKERDPQVVFIQARQAIIEAREKNEPKKLYSIFNQFLAKRFGLPERQAFEETMRAAYDRLSVIEEKEKWYLFYMGLLSCSFGREMSPQLFTEALSWLDRIHAL